MNKYQIIQLMIIEFWHKHINTYVATWQIVTILSYRSLLLHITVCDDIYLNIMTHLNILLCKVLNINIHQLVLQCSAA